MPRDASASLPDQLVFPRARRLLTPADFRAVFSSGRRVHSRHWMMVVLARDATQPARLGLAISKKCDKRAVVRNRIKRAAREWFRHTQLCGVDIVITGKRELVGLTSAQMQALLADMQPRITKALR